MDGGRVLNTRMWTSDYGSHLKEKMDSLGRDHNSRVTYPFLLFGPGFPLDLEVPFPSAPNAGLFASSGFEPGPPLRFRPFDAGAAMLSSADGSGTACSDSLSCGVDSTFVLEVVDEEVVATFGRDSLRAGCADWNWARTVDGSRRMIFLLGLLGFGIVVAFFTAGGNVGNDGVEVDVDIVLIFGFGVAGEGDVIQSHAFRLCHQRWGNGATVTADKTSSSRYWCKVRAEQSMQCCCVLLSLLESETSSCGG